MVTSDFRLEVEIRPFRVCAIKNTQYNAYLWPNRQSFRVFKEIRVVQCYVAVVHSVHVIFIIIFIDRTQQYSNAT